jgi:hypothetical protein
MKIAEANWKMIRNTRANAKLICLVLAAMLGLPHANCWAGDAKYYDEYRGNRFSLGIGAGLVRFDTNFKFTEKDSGVSLFVDGEGTLGLPEEKGIPVIYGYYRFAKRHGIGWSYFRVRRQATLFQLNESKDFNLGDLTINAGANAKITLEDQSSFYNVSYNLTLKEDERNLIFASFGLYGLDLKYVLEANGEITLQGTPVVDDRYRQEASVFAPLPMFGIDAWFSITPRWALGTKISLVGGTYQDTSAGVLDTVIRSRYKINKHLSGYLGISYFNADVTIDEADQRTDVAYGLDGLYLGLGVNF